MVLVSQLPLSDPPVSFDTGAIHDSGVMCTNGASMMLNSSCWIGQRFEKFAPAFDAILARKLILSYDDFIEMEDNTAQSQKQRLAYQKVKQRVLQEHAKKKLGRSKTFTREQVDDLAPIDEELTEADKAAIVEVGAHVSMMEVDAPRKRQADAHTETSPTKHRVMKPELPDASSSLGSSAKHAPAEPKISTAVKSTQPLPPSTSEPSSGSGLKRPPPPPKGVSAAAPPVRTQAADVKLEYFDMAITGLPGHYLNVPADPKKRQEVRVSVPGSMVVTPLIPMLGSELVKLPGVQRNKVPSDRGSPCCNWSTQRFYVRRLEPQDRLSGICSFG